MTIKASSVRKLWKEAGSGKAFREKLREMLGVKYDARKDRYFVDPAAQQVGTEEFSVRALTEEFCGQEFVSEMHTGPLSSSRMEMLRAARAPRETALFEDVLGVDPSSMQDINAWTATVAGLVEVKLLEGYNSPEYIGNEFVTVMPRRQNGGKLIGIPYVNPAFARAVAPGIEFPSAGLNQLYVQIRPNTKVGAKLGLDRETVVYDLTGELTSSAETIGKSLGYVREYVIAGGVQGMTNVVSSSIDASITSQIGSSFRMNAAIDATPNPTYQTAGVTTNGNAYNYVNSQTKTFADWTSLSDTQALLNLMRDPVNGLPFATEIRKVLVDPSQWQLALYVTHQMEVLTATGTVATAPFQGTGSTFPPIVARAPASTPGSELNNWLPYHSNIWHQALLDGGVSEANAKKRWLAGDPARAFIWQQGWDLQTQQANPSDADMLSKDIVALWVSSWMGQFGVREPRYVIQNTE